MYLAGILGLCILFAGSRYNHANAGPVAFGSPAALASSSVHGPLGQDSGQEPAKPEASQQQAPPPDSTPPAESQPAKQMPRDGQTPPPRKPAKPRAAARKKPTLPASGQPSPQSSPTPPKSQTPAKSTEAPSKPDQAPSKKVVREGSTADPTTQLAPGITAEQAARQRETTNQLLSSTDAALQKLSGQSLTSDQQESVAQIRSVMQQSKAADKDGDLQLAYKLALKAHLLSDGLSKQ